MKYLDWIDLDSGAAPANVQTDVCIVGAGAAGTYLARELARRGIDSVILEAGGTTAVSGELMGFDPIFGRDPYPGSLAGRFFGVGGSTSHWGGALVPHSRHDLQACDAYKSTWEIIVKRANGQVRSVLSSLGYKLDLDFEEYPRQLHPVAYAKLAQAGIDVHSNLIMPFRRKNFSRLWGDISFLQRSKLFFNATAKTWTLTSGQGGSLLVTGLESISRSGKSINVLAHRYIIAAGAIESARILLEIDRASGQKIFNSKAMPGRFLADHISLPIAEVAREDRVKARELFGPRFVDGWMRSFRFLISSPTSGEPRGFCHLIFEQDNTGFKVAKEFVGALQARRLPDLSVVELLRGANGLSALAYSRLFRSRLHIPNDTPVRLQLDIEQMPFSGNCMNLSEEIDAYGRPRVKVDWSIGEGDIQSMAAAAKRVLSLWPNHGGDLPRLNPLDVAQGIIKPYDAYHPVGTCCMGDGDNAVVDFGLKVVNTENLWSVSTGVLPTAGTANPTLTMLCLAQELADRFSRRL
jgi:choline dehydrogenase-like flavoprotein